MIKNEELLCESANGKRVVFDPINSHTATHFKDAPGLRALTRDLISSMTLDGDLIAKDVEMGRVIGDTDVVEVDSSDEIVYAMRKSREDQGYVPFTKSRPPQPSTLLSIHLVKKDSRTYELASVWIGKYKSPMFPQMATATVDSIPYWSKHAFAWGSQEIIRGTELNKCPW